MIILGLTGSIGMGKSTTAQMFRDQNIPVHDADAVVHKLYAGKAASLIEAAFPGTTDAQGVDRVKLGNIVVGNEAAMKELEAIVHPLVRAAEIEFLENAKANNADLVILDIPLLFETNGQERVDGIIVVTAPASVQKQRVLARAGMDEEKFKNILSRQVPDAEKRQRADFIIDTSLGLENAQNEVTVIIEKIRSGNWDPFQKP